MKLFVTSDSGGSGHGATGLNTIRHLLDKNIEINWSTHQWCWSLQGWQLGQGRRFPDKRFKEQLIRRQRVNPDYLLQRKRDFQDRPHNLEELPFNMDEANDTNLLIKDFEGREDVNLAIGDPGFAERQPTYCPTISETTINTTRCPEKWKDYQELTDEIWVPCQWAKDSMVNTGLDSGSIKVVPYGVQFGRPTTCDRITRLMDDDTFTFGVTARWVNLKGLDVLIKAYINEFVPGEDDVRLFIKTSTNQQRPLSPRIITGALQQFIQRERIPDPPEIGFATTPFSQQTYWDMLGAFDCLALPSRAEAIGLVLVEGAGIGLPVITTDFSEPPNYLRDEPGAWLVDAEEVPVQQHSDLLYFYGDEYRGTWGNPDVDNLRQRMRHVYELWKESPEELNRRTEQTKQNLREKFDWEKHIQARLERIREIAG